MGKPLKGQEPMRGALTDCLHTFNESLFYASLTQLVECHFCKVKVAGSIPARGSKRFKYLNFLHFSVYL